MSPAQRGAKSIEAFGVHGIFCSSIPLSRYLQSRDFVGCARCLYVPASLCLDNCVHGYWRSQWPDFILCVYAVCSLPEYFVISSSLSDSDTKAALSKARDMCFPVSQSISRLLANAYLGQVIFQEISTSGANLVSQFMAHSVFSDIGDDETKYAVCPGQSD